MCSSESAYNDEKQGPGVEDNSSSPLVCLPTAGLVCKEVRPHAKEMELNDRRLARRLYIRIVAGDASGHCRSAGGALLETVALCVLLQILSWS